MIRIRPGRSWRLNPGYREKLEALTPPHARRFDPSAILDVVGIEIDGVDVAAGVGEAQVVLAVDELSQALVRLASGAPAAQATVGPGPTEALLEARGADVLLSLVRLARPSRILAGALLVDGAQLRVAAAAAAQGLVGDLLAISPALAGAPVVKRLERAARTLAKRKVKPAAAWPPAPARSVRSSLIRAGRGRARCDVQVPLEAAARLSAPIEGAPLASLLCRGTVALRIASAPAVAAEGPLYLSLRDAVHAAGDLVEAWESGERTFQLALGGSELQIDLTREEARAPGWTRAAAASPPEIAMALAGAAKSFAERAQRLGGADAFADLRESALAVLRHCRDLASGDLRRAPEAVAAPPLRHAPRAQARPVPSGKVRRLVFRSAWRARVPDAGALLVCGREALGPLAAPGQATGAGGALVVASSEAAAAFDLDTGAPLWAHPCSGPRAAARCGNDVLLLGPDSLLRLDAGSGALRWRRRLHLGDPRAVWPVPGGAVALAGPVLARVSDAGSLGWRAPLEGAVDALFAFETVLVLGCAGNTLALDAESGRTLWRREGRPAACAGSLVAIAGDRLAALDGSTGGVRWEMALPGAASIAPWGALVAVAAGPAVQALRAADGSPRLRADLPWGTPTLLAPHDEDQGTLLAFGPGGAAALLDGSGRIRWTLPGEGAAQASAGVLAGGLLALPGPRLRLVDPSDGLVVAVLGDAAPRLFAVGPDLGVALVAGDDLSLYRLATHLSVV